MVVTFVALAAYVLAAAASFIAMLWIGFAGLAEIFGTLLEHPMADFHNTGSATGMNSGFAKDMILNILEGFELLLLAPLVFVIVVTIGRYLRQLLVDDSMNESSRRSLHGVKALIATLLISVVAADLVMRLIHRSDQTAETFLVGALLILLLLVFVAFLLLVPRGSVAAPSPIVRKPPTPESVT